MKEIIYFGAIILIVLASCSTQDVCEDDLKAEAISNFFTYQDGVMTDTLISGLTLYGIRENKADSLLYDSAKVSRINLPLDPNHDHSTFIMEINDIVDTITFFHNTRTYLVSYTCGFANNFTITKLNYTTTSIIEIELLIDYVKAEESDIEPEEHIRIYF